MNKKCLVCKKDRFKTKVKKTLRETRQIECRSCNTIYSVDQKPGSPIIPVSVIKIV